MISEKNILNLKNRRDIYQFIFKNPGMNITEISQKMKIKRSVIRYHLKHLIKNNMIIIKKDKKNKRLYVYDKLSKRDQELLNMLRQKIPFKIIMTLLFPGYFSKIEIAKDLEIHHSTVSFHIKKLIELEIIKPVEIKDGRIISSFRYNDTISNKPTGREIFYSWKDYELVKNVYKLLITYKDSMIDPNIIDKLEYFCKEKGLNKKVKNLGYNGAIDKIMDAIDEIGMFPYRY